MTPAIKLYTEKGTVSNTLETQLRRKQWINWMLSQVCRRHNWNR